MMLFRLIFILMLVFLPGYFLTILLNEKSNFFKRLVLSFLLGSSSLVIFSFVFLFFNILKVPYLIIFWTFFVLAVSLGIIFIFKNRGKTKCLFVIKEEWKALSIKEKKYFFGLLFLSIIFSFFFVFHHHFFPNLYLFPIHIDEWWSAASVKSLIDGRDLNSNPYTFYKEINYKPGFVSFWGFILEALKLDPVKIWAFLPFLNVFLISFFSALLIYEKKKNFWAGIFSIVFITSLGSNVNVLGWWFFVAFTFAFLFLVPLLFYFEDFFWSDYKNFFVGTGIAVALGLIYPPFLGFFILFSFPFCFEFLKKFKWRAAFIFLFLLVSFFVFLNFSPYKSFWEEKTPFLVSKIVESFFVPNIATPAYNNYLNILNIVSPFLFVFAFYGLFSIWRWEWTRILISGFFICTLLYFLILVFKVSFLSFYGREFYLFGFVVSLIASIGAGDILQNFKHLIFKWGFLILVVFILFNNYFFSEESNVYFIMNEANFKALNWLKNQKDLKNEFVFADAFDGMVITPISGFPVKLNWLSLYKKDFKDIPFNFSDFDKLNCNKKKEILNRLDAKILYASQRQNCPFLKEIYAQEEVFIYQLSD